MRGRSAKRLLLYMLVLPVILCIFPVSGAACAKWETIPFSSFEELKELLSDESPQPGASLLCTADELLFAEDFEIPPGVGITFCSFTVPEGVSLSVREEAELQTYSLTVRGSLFNRGKIIQRDLEAPWADGEIETTARIPGHIENKGEMYLTDVFGRSNINRFGGKLTIEKTASYQRKLEEAAGIATPAPTDRPTPAPTASPGSRLRKTSDLMEDLIPKLSFFLVLALTLRVVILGIESAIREKRGIQEPSSKKAAALSDADRRRAEQLDSWLQSGLIDRKEYEQRKKRYR